MAEEVTSKDAAAEHHCAFAARHGVLRALPVACSPPCTGSARP